MEEDVAAVRTGKLCQTFLGVCFFFFSKYITWPEKEMATHSSILAWRIPRTEEPGELHRGKLNPWGRKESDTSERLTTHNTHTLHDRKSSFRCLIKLGSVGEEERVPRWHSGKETASQWSRHRAPGFNLWVRKILWRRKWQPTPVFLPGKFHGQRILVGFSPWGLKDLDTAKHLSKQTKKTVRHWGGQ